MHVWLYTTTQVYLGSEKMSKFIINNSCLFRSYNHGRASAAKKDVRHTSVLFTGTTKSPFSTPHISLTNLISIKFTYFMPSIYVTLHTKFEEN